VQRGCDGGWRIKVLPVAGTVRGHSSRTGDPWNPSRIISHNSSSPSDHHRCSSSRSSSFLQLAFFIAHPPPLANTHAPSLLQRDISAVKISTGKCSENSHQSLRQWNLAISGKERGMGCVSFWRCSLGFSLNFLSCYPYSLVRHSLRFGKLDIITLSWETQQHQICRSITPITTIGKAAISIIQ